MHLSRARLALVGFGLLTAAALAAGLWLGRGGGSTAPSMSEWPAAGDPPAGAVAGDADLAKFCQSIPASDHPSLGRATLERLASLPARMPDQDVLLAAAQLEQNELAAMFETFDRLAAHFGDTVPPSLRRLRAQANLRAAETANCLTGTNSFICLLNRPAGAAYPLQTYTLDAIADLEALVAAAPSDVEGRWLLNIAYATLGLYPDGVPAAYRIPPEAFDRGHAAPRFVDVGRSAGVGAVGLLGAGVLEDFDGDGLLDIFTTSYHPCDHALLFRNRGDGLFEDRSEAAGLAGQLGGFNAVQTDFNNDGSADLMVMRGGWQSDRGTQRRSLLRNDGDGTFTDVTHAAGLAAPVYASQTAVWADYDLDGDLDFYSANETSDRGPFPSQLFRNNGDGTFTDVAPAAGVTNDRMAKGAAWGDFDNDGDPDLYVSNIGPNRLYRNDGGAFVDVAAELGVTAPNNRSFATWFWDFDNDGWLDIYVAGYGASVMDVANDYLGVAKSGELPRLYRNTGGRFEDVTVAVGLDRILLPMGANYGDVDNDGFDDVYLGTGDPDFTSLMPNVMFRNDGGRAFLDVTAAAGVGHLPKGHGIAFGDADNDGDQDIYLDAGGFFTSDVSANALFANPGSAHHWLTVRLVGTQANRAAVGARITARLASPTGERMVHRLVGTGGSFGANSLQAEIGLGDATAVERLEIWWPAGGALQVFEGIAADQAIEVTEGEAAYRVLDRPVIRLAGLPTGP